MADRPVTSTVAPLSGPPPAWAMAPIAMPPISPVEELWSVLPTDDWLPGYLPGDLITVDRDRELRDKDVVVAEIPQPEGPAIVLGMFHATSHGPVFRPLDVWSPTIFAIGGTAGKVLGVVTMMRRGRQGRAQAA